MNNNGQIEEHEISFYNSIFREDNNELKKNSVKGKYTFWVRYTFFAEKQLPFSFI